MDHVVVVGAGLAGLRAAEALRRNRFTGRITLVGAEQHFPPYDRPPLSKQLLAGTWTLDKVMLRTDDDLDVELMLGRRATALDARGKVLTLDGDESLPYDGLVIATGAAPRHLPSAHDHDGVFVLRTLEDCLALRAALTDGPRVAVVGAGFIGCEVAATCRQLGLDVTVVEFLPLPLVRVVGPLIGEVCASLHREHGVELVLNVGVAGVEGKGTVERLALTDGTSVAADVVVVGIGVAPATEWLEGSGLTLDNGIVCDETCAAVGVPDVVAAGDVCRWRNRRFGEVMRIEHWTNAAEQAEAAAATLLAGPGQAEPFAPIPYFWSDQYDAKFMSVGLVGPDDDVEVVEGSVDDRKFVATYTRGGKIVGAFACNHPRALMQWRRHIEEATQPTA